MTVRLLFPDKPGSLPDYHHVAIATGTTQVHIAGQVAWDENDDLVADDLAGQVAQIYRNVAKHLAAAGATFHDVVRITWYAAHWERSMYDDFRAGVEQAAREFDLPMPPLALIGVGRIWEDGVLIEAEVTAVLDAVPLADEGGAA